MKVSGWNCASVGGSFHTEKGLGVQETSVARHTVRSRTMHVSRISCALSEVLARALARADVAYPDKNTTE